MIWSQKFGFSAGRGQLCRKRRIMNHIVETMYEEVGRIVASDCGARRKAKALSDFYDGLAGDAVMLDNVLYERIGMSCEEVIEALQGMIIKKSC